MTPPDDQPDRSERSHYIRTPAPWVAGCSDIGLKHKTNQDAMALAARSEPDRETVIVVADGVSTALGAEVASLAASEAACSHLTSRQQNNIPLNIALVQAFSLANEAVLEAAHGGEPSACTLVAAVIQPGQIAVGNVGDSRAYWIGDDTSCNLLTTDDSMAQARIMLGMSRSEAEQSRQAHSITKWLGRDSTEVTPSVTTQQPTGKGWLLVCTDGLWNYASSPSEMFEVFNQCRDSDEPAAIAEAMTLWAIQQGGRDNITVAIARYEG